MALPKHLRAIALGAILWLVGCSSVSDSRDTRVQATPTTAAIETVSTTSTFARAAREASPETPRPLLHAVGLIERLVADEQSWNIEPNIFASDLTTVAAIGCTPGTETCDPAGLANLQASGIDIVNIATRAVAAADESAVADFVGAAAEVGLSVVGMSAPDPDVVRPTVVIRGETRIAVFAIDLGTSTTASGTVTSEHLDALLNAIDATRSDDVPVVAFVDWGVVDARAASAEQIERADQLFSAGTTAVIGHGPGLLQRFESDEDTFTAFNLGRAQTASEGLSADTAAARIDLSSEIDSCLLAATASSAGLSFSGLDADTPCS